MGPYTSSWFLTSIVSPTGDDVITLDYTLPTTVEHDVIPYEEKFQYETLLVNCLGKIGITPEINIYRLQSIRLSQITTATQKLVFESTTREDFTDEYKLQAIKIYSPSDDLQKTILFEYDEDIGTGDPNRLFLINVREQAPGGSTLPPYSFGYNDSVTLPDRLSKSVDHWGFYNGALNNTYIPSMTVAVPNLPTLDPVFLSGADREPNETTMKAGVLTSITYPTGGRTDFTYEPHYYGYVNGSNLPILPGEEEDATAAPVTNGTVETLFIIEPGVDPGESVNVNIEVIFGVNCGEEEEDDCYAAVLDSNDQVIEEYIASELGNPTLVLAPATYKLHATTIAGPGLSTWIEATWREWTQPDSVMAGGLRVKEIRDHDAMDPNKDIIKRYQYNTTSNALGPNRSSGVLVNEPLYHYVPTITRRSNH